MKKDYIQSIESGERRFFNPEIRAEGDNTIEGVAAVVNKTTDLGWFEERIAPGAFDDVLKDDVVALFNHDPNLPLARTGAGLDLFLTKSGDLGYRFEAPKTTIGQDLRENIKSGVVTKSSFAFTIESETWDFADDKEGRDKDLRTITKFKRLYDVSPVTYPAYADTSVAARSVEGKHQKDEHERALLKRDRFEVDQIFIDLNIDIDE